MHLRFPELGRYRPRWPSKRTVGEFVFAAAIGSTLLARMASAQAGGPGAPAPFTPLPIDDPNVRCTNIAPAAPFYGPAPDLPDHGVVLPNVRIVDVFVGPYWSTPDGEARRTAVDGFVKEYVQSPVNGVLASYGAGEASFGGSVAVPNTSSANVDQVVVEQIATELDAGQDPTRIQLAPTSWLGEKLSGVGDLIHTAAVDVGAELAKPDGRPVTIYNEVLEPGMVITTDLGDTSQMNTGYSAFHFDATGKWGAPIVYTVEPWPTEGNGPNLNNNAFDSAVATMSHELGEARTDPYFPLGWVNLKYGDSGEAADMADYGAGAYAFQCDAAGNPQQAYWSPGDGAYEIQAKK